MPTGLSSPFDNFISASEGNESHTEFTTLNSTWLLSEIKAQPKNVVCLPFCEDAIQMEGSNVICNGERVKFELLGLPPFERLSDLRWESSDGQLLGMQIFTGEARANLFLSGSTRVTAQVKTPCKAQGDTTFTRFVWVGEPERVTEQLINQRRKIGSCFEPIYVYEAVRFRGATEYEWEFSSDDPNFKDLEIQTEGLRVVVSAPSLKEGRSIRFKMRLRGSNRCGEMILEAEETYYQASLCDCSTGNPECVPLVECIGCPSNPLLEIYPNPSTGNRNLQVVLQVTKSKTRMFTLYDSQGNPVWQKESKDTKLSIPIEDLPFGLYHLLVTSEEETMSRNVFKY